MQINDISDIKSKNTKSILNELRFNDLLTKKKHYEQYRIKFCDSFESVQRT